MRRNRLAALALAVALALPASPAAAQSAPAPPSATLEAGDRVEASLAWSRHALPDAAGGTALLARSDDFADALASGTAQVRHQAPLLLTDGAALDDRVAAELARLEVTRVVLLGGPAALSEDVAADLRSRGYEIERVAGSTRITTAVAIAERFGDARDHVVLARAFADGTDPTRAFADSLAAGPTGTILLTGSDALSQATADHLVAAGVTSVQLAGGEAAISEAVVADLASLGITATRRAGGSRFATAAALEFIRHPHHPPSGYLLVDGTSPDAWAAGLPAALFAARTGAAVLLTAGPVIPSVTARLLLQRERVTCAPLLPAAACRTARLLQSSSHTFSPGGTLVAAARTDGAGGPSALVHLLRTDAAGTLCYRYDPFDLGPLRAVRLESDDSRLVAELTLDTASSHRPEAAPRGYGCVVDADPQQVEAVFAAPRAHRVHVVPVDGAAATGTFAPIARDHASAFGRGIDLPGGQPDATLRAQVLFTDAPGELCLVYDVTGLDDAATAVHLHEGAPEEGGAVLADLPPPTPSGTAVCTTADADVVAAMPDSAATHLDIHTAAHPDGAVSGSVRTPPPPPPT